MELRVSLETLGEGGADVIVDNEVARAIQAAAAELERETGRLESGDQAAGSGLSTADLLRMPDVVRVRRHNLELTAQDRSLVLEVVTTAIERLVSMREGEGAQLQAILAEKVAALSELATRLAAAREGVSQQLAANMRQRLAELLGDTEVDEDRLAQETAVLAEKIDIQEEIDRLRAHLETFTEALSSDEAVGRRLDFLAQEIHRELNTLGVKCRDSTMAQWAVDAKLACEQLREQVQNVE